MFVPIGFGRIFLHDILYKNIEDAGLPVEGIVRILQGSEISRSVVLREKTVGNSAAS